MKIGVISDTHIPDRADSIPKEIMEAFKKVDMIIHTGDFVKMSVLDKLKSVCKNVIAVRGNMDHEDVKAFYSNYGDWVDIAAPGGETNITSQGVLSTLPGNSYGFYQGTSMACPHVSGAAALVVSKYQELGLNPATVWMRLTAASDPIDASNPAYAGLLGDGRLNAARALETADTIPPSQILDLAIVNTGIVDVTMQWTAPGASADSGYAAFYDIRYSELPIDESNFYSAQSGQNSLIPQLAGSTEELALGGLMPNTTYYFAIKAVDMFGNAGSVSNNVFTTTLEAPRVTVSPQDLYVEMFPNTQDSAYFIVKNTGNSLLTYSFPDFITTGSINSTNNVAPIQFNEPVTKGHDTR